MNMNLLALHIKAVIFPAGVPKVEAVGLQLHFQTNSTSPCKANWSCKLNRMVVRCCSGTNAFRMHCWLKAAVVVCSCPVCLKSAGYGREQRVAVVKCKEHVQCIWLCWLCVVCCVG